MDESCFHFCLISCFVLLLLINHEFIYLLISYVGLFKSVTRCENLPSVGIAEMQIINGKIPKNPRTQTEISEIR